MADFATLSCARCSKPANLQCPKCVELKLPREVLLSGTSVISTQDCFKASWSSHKSVHVKAKQSNGTGSAENEGWLYCMKKGQSRSPKLPYFEWTGTLRPYPVSSKRVVPSHIDLPDWAADGIPKEEPSSDFQRLVEESGVSGLNSKTHMKIMLKWMRGRKMLKLFPNQVGSNKKFLLCTLPEDPHVTEFINSTAVKVQSKKPSSKKKKQKQRR